MLLHFLPESRFQAGRSHHRHGIAFSENNQVTPSIISVLQQTYERCPQRTDVRTFRRRRGPSQVGCTFLFPRIPEGGKIRGRGIELNLSGKPLFLNKNPLLVSKPCPPPGKGGTGKDEFLHGRQFPEGVQRPMLIHDYFKTRCFRNALHQFPGQFRRIGKDDQLTDVAGKPP